jgi:hypothetical protein
MEAWSASVEAHTAGVGLAADVFMPSEEQPAVMDPTPTTSSAAKKRVMEER